MIADRRSNLLADLDAFLGEHRDCGELASAVEGDVVWMACDGARLARTSTLSTPGTASFRQRL
jgi:hypothetical protein